MKGSKLIDLLFGYERIESSFDESHVARAERRFAERSISGVGSSYAKRILSHPVSRFFAKLSNSFSLAPVRNYGVFFLSFGLATLFLNFANYYFNSLPGIPALALIVGAAAMLISLPLFLTGTPLADFVQGHAFTENLLFDVLCLRHVRRVEATGSVMTWQAAVALGAIIAILGFVLPLGAVLIGLAAIIFVAMTFSSPEFGFMITLLILPVFPIMPYPTLIPMLTVGISAISMALKVILGKRVFNFEQYDLVIFLFTLFIAIGGIFNGAEGSFGRAAAMTVLLTSYFLAANIIVNRRIADNAIKIIVFSSVPTSVYGIITFFTNDVHPEWIDPVYSGGIAARATSTFGNPNIYAVFLLVATVFSVSFAFDKSKRNHSVYYTLASLLNISALVLTFTRGAWIALILTALGFIVIRSRRAPKILLAPLAIIPVVPLFIPDNVIERFLSVFNKADSSIASRLSIWRSSLRILADKPLIGTGVGDKAFAEEFLKYAEDSVTAPHSHNLFLEIGCELGIFALLLFVFLILVRIIHRATYARYVRDSSVDNLCTMSGAAFFALLTFGMTDYVWYSTSMYLLFWIVFGIGSATLRISKNEYSDTMAAISLHTEHSANHSTATINIK
ncbi:MAG: hypothetical protein E7617_06675 [Ruminococcaceae bacterium]|nr:hypothetical protein [Oscillospiraceae bacterium]